jgi:hypothetical protein
MSARLESLDQEIAAAAATAAAAAAATAAATANAAAATSKLAELEARRPQLIAEVIAEREAEAAAATAAAAAATAAATALRAALAPAEPFHLPPVQLPAPAGGVKKIVVDYSQIPKGAQLMHRVGRVKEEAIEKCFATFHDSNNIVTPAGVRYKSIHAWAIHNMERNREKIGRKNVTLNVFDKGSHIFFVKGGVEVPLHTIQTVTHV